jgi:hypothetical protein
MTNLLLVPIHLDALYLPNGMSVAEATADFSRLPYFQERDHNPDTVNLSESILTQAFQNKNLYLKPGIHLHWALPDALTKEGKEGFPAVPNRWLVRRSKSGNVDKTWIVESDYLFPSNTVYQEDSVTYPDLQASEGGLRFCYLGRKVLLDNWPIKDDKPQYLDRLTAVGYGEPTFAAFYPNCRSVFGFHDSDAKAEDKLQYDVIGWYFQDQNSKINNADENCCLNEILQLIENECTTDSKKTPLENLLNTLKDQLKWDTSIDDKDKNSSIKEVVFICYSRLTFNTSSPPQPQTDDIKISLAVANTGTEALSAYLATTIDTNKKKLIENQLEALQLVETLSSQSLDIGAKFEELRHESGFNAVSAGTVWKICLDNSSSQLEKAQSQTKLNLPSDWVSALKSINEMQQEYDLVDVQVKSRQRQLFADWYKYMVCVYPPEHSWDNYPDIDQVKQYIEQQGIEPLENLISMAEYLNFKIAIEIDLLQEKINSYNSQAEKHNKLLQNNSQDTTTTNRSIPIYHLESVTVPRYWEPKEPVVLIIGKDEEGKNTNKNAIKASERHGQDGRLSKDAFLECHIVQSDKTIADLAKELEDKNITKKSEEFKIVFDEINSLYKKNPEAIGFSEWNQQPWNPFLLQWLVEIFPVNNSGNQSSSSHDYGYDFIVKNYQLEEQAIDLAPQTSCETIGDTEEENNKIKTDRDSNVYSGFSILTAYANDLLQKRIAQFLDTYTKVCNYKEKLEQPNKNDDDAKKELQKLMDEVYNLMPANYDNPKYRELSNKKDYLKEVDNIKGIITWYETNPLISRAKKSQEILKEKDFQCLSQSLGGFNQALLMRKQTLQLMIDDPIGFEDYQDFTRQVQDLVGEEVRSAPQPLDDFNPIRAGEMRIISLELVDTFGQIRKLDWDEQIIKPEAMKTKQPNRVLLSPRLVQPCRINFRWLDANDTNNQVTDAETTPICGWILPNNLNGSLMIYDNKGVALGSINVNADWDHAPGNKPLEMDDKNPSHPKIPNPHLCKVVAKIIDLGQDFLKNFLACLNNALENIDPENFAQHESIALLMGRPIAVVRASVNLELQGLAAINQDWNVFRKEMQQNLPMEDRDTDNFDDVQFPIRIGEFKQFNDGVIGYWKEISNVGIFVIFLLIINGFYNFASLILYKYLVFYAQQIKDDESRYIETQAFMQKVNPKVSEGPINIIQSINSPAQILTMLVDPRCVFHATSGILPSKAINIPPEQYTEALKNIKVTFLTAPILTDKDQLHLPLLTEPGYDWSWLEKKGEIWSEITMTPIILKQTFCAHFSSDKVTAAVCWQGLIDQSWLIELDTEKAKIVSKDELKKQSKLKLSSKELAGLEETIDKIFDLYHIVIEPASTRATFGSSQGIRDGWLVLSKNTQQNEV